MSNPQPTDEAWFDAGAKDALFGSAPCKAVDIDGVRVGLFLVDGAVHAIDDLCTHGHAHLTEGELDGFEVECPLHAGLFDVRNGKALCSPLTRDVRCHQVRVENEHVMIRMVR